MKRWAFLFIFLWVCSGLLLNIDDTVYSEETEPAYVIADLKQEVSPTFSRIIFVSNKKIEFVSYELKDPYRIVIDLIGVVFCELEEHMDCTEGPVRSIDVVKTPYAQTPKGLDTFFYAVDYIIITPASPVPYATSTAEDGKVVLVDIGQAQPKQVEISKEPAAEESAAGKPQAALAEPPAGRQPEQPYLSAEPKEPEPYQQQKPEAPKLYAGSENLIDYVNYEVLEDSLLVIISSVEGIDYDISTKPKPNFCIVLKPKKKVFTELEEELKLTEGGLKSLRLVKDKLTKRPPDLDEYFYPVREIRIELAKEAKFDTYFNEDASIWVVEVYYTEKAKEEMVEEEAPEVLGETEIEKEKALTRVEVARELKEELKKEGLLAKELIAEEKKREEEKRKEQAAVMAETIGRETLKDLIIKGRGILNLTQAQEIGKENSPQVKASKEEAALARMKIKEALRAMFPQAKLKGSHTTGDVLTVDFIEEVYGVQGEQPIYQGGRLWSTYKQSKVNLKLADMRRQKLENDIDYKVAEAYYNTVTTVMNVKLQQDLLKEAEKVTRAAEDRYKDGLSTALEILNVRSQYNQIQFQLAAAERDLALARFKLQQAMNIDIAEEGPAVDIGEVDTELRFFKVLDVDLYKCLELASDNQPDILVNKLLVESNQYGEKIAKGKDNFKIDVTGFYGKSDSYYSTESRNLQKDWNIGIKVSRPFWGNTASYAFTKEETSRKVGQTDRTGSTANTGEFAILDNMSIASEIKEAKISRQKADNDLIEARRQAALEVKEAYYSYQEAIIQVKNSLEKVKFQEEAVKVTQAQTELDQAMQSQLLEAMIKLSDERAVYIKALSDYNLAISKLNKAIGIRGYFIVD